MGASSAAGAEREEGACSIPPIIPVCCCAAVRGGTAVARDFPVAADPQVVTRAPPPLMHGIRNNDWPAGPALPTVGCRLTAQQPEGDSDAATQMADGRHGRRIVGRRHGGPGRHGDGADLVSQGADHGLPEGLRGGQSGDQDRDPEQEHHGRRGLCARAARGPAARHHVGQRARRLRGVGAQQAADGRARDAQSGRARQDRQLPAQRPAGPVLRPGAGRLRDHVEHALPEGAQAGGAQGVERSDAARVLRPHRHLLALALGHHAADGGDHPAGRGLGQGLAPAAVHDGQCRRRDRPQLCRARWREQRPVRHRHRDRFLRAGGQVFWLPGGLRLPGDDCRGACQHRADRGRQECR